MARSTCLAAALVLLPLLLLWSGGGGGGGGMLAAVECAPQLPFNSLLSELVAAGASGGGAGVPLLEGSALAHLQHQLGTLSALGTLLGLPFNLTDTAMG